MKLSLLTKTEIAGSQADFPVPMDIRPLIYEIRGRQVMLDWDLATLYGVLTKNLDKAVKRNVERFPEDFMFQLSKDESLRFQNGTLNGEGDSACENEEVLRFQTGTLKLGRGKYLKHQPYAFTENGMATFCIRCTILNGWSLNSLLNRRLTDLCEREDMGIGMDAHARLVVHTW